MIAFCFCQPREMRVLRPKKYRKGFYDYVDNREYNVVYAICTHTFYLR